MKKKIIDFNKASKKVRKIKQKKESIYLFDKIQEQIQCY